MAQDIASMGSTGRLQGKTALITGGTSGIGLATAQLFQQEGAQIAITGRDLPRIEEAKQLLADSTLAIASDAGNLAEIDSLLAQLQAQFGGLDILFLNAGIVQPQPFAEVTEADFDAIFNINFKGIFFTVQKALPLLRHGASVIVVTSIASERCAPPFSVYGASKAALRSLCKSLGLALIGQGIRVNAISPGPIDTMGFERMGLAPEQLAAKRAEMVQGHPMQRFGVASEVAQAALFLACDDSSYITCEEIKVDGGYSARP